MGKRGNRSKARKNKLALKGVDDNSAGPNKRTKTEGDPSTVRSELDDGLHVSCDEPNVKIPRPLAFGGGTHDADQSDTDNFSKLWGHLKYGGSLRSEDDVPTKVQNHCWSILWAKLNLIAISPTGTGKTLAYTIPSMLSIANLESYVLILVPTRELVQQVAKVCTKIAKGLKRIKMTKHSMPVISIYGGTDRSQQEQLLLHCANKSRVVVATPGRLSDLLGEEHLKQKYSTPSFIIFDEADQLAKDDLAQQIEQSLESFDTKNTTIALVSATLPKRALPKFIQWVGTSHILVKTGNMESTSEVSHETSGENAGEEPQVKSDNGSNERVVEGLSRIPDNIEQIVHVCSEHKKPKKLMSTLKAMQKEFQQDRSQPRGIVFFSRIEKLKNVSKLLVKDGVQCIELHSQLPNQVREKNLHLFSVGQCPIILATDLAARGIHVNGVRFCVQYDFSSNIEQYVHRCGRAGRDGNKAKVFGFFTRNLQPLAGPIVQLLKGCNAAVDPNLVSLSQEDPLKKSEKKKERQQQERENPSKQKPKPKSNNLAATKKTDRAVQNASLMGDDSDDEFQNLLPNRIVLKRAAHVSEASDSSHDDDDDDDNDKSIK